MIKTKSKFSVYNGDLIYMTIILCNSKMKKKEHKNLVLVKF